MNFRLWLKKNIIPLLLGAVFIGTGAFIVGFSIWFSTQDLICSLLTGIIGFSLCNIGYSIIKDYVND